MYLSQILRAEGKKRRDETWERGEFFWVFLRSQYFSSFLIKYNYPNAWAFYPHMIKANIFADNLCAANQWESKKEKEKKTVTNKWELNNLGTAQILQLLNGKQELS